MSESSEPTSSQLDDIELAQPAAKLYEHQTDVRFLFPGEENQQWSLPVMPTHDSVRTGHLELSELRMIGDEPGHSFTSRAQACRNEGMARLSFDSGAVSDAYYREPEPTPRRVSETRSDASENGILRIPEVGPHTVVVELVSPAFVLNEHTWRQGLELGRCPAEIICQRVCTGLGVEKGSLRYFELKEVPVSQMRSSGRYAVSIDRAGANLFAVKPFCACS
jgi:hypothetical protein